MDDLGPPGSFFRSDRANLGVFSVGLFFSTGFGPIKSLKKDCFVLLLFGAFLRNYAVRGPSKNSVSISKLQSFVYMGLFEIELKTQTNNAIF